MATRKEVNKYYPPDWDPSKGSLNTYHGEGWRNGSATVNGRAGFAKGINIIRFEMPWNIWCNGCNSHIGRGVRYNAEKKKAGSYYTTTIWAFTMKCHLCPNKITIETDPKNDDYKITEGARRKVESFSASKAGTHELMGEEEKRRLAADPMYRLEHGESDKRKAQKSKPALTRLIEMKSSTRDYDENAKLRAAFRVKRKQLKAQAHTDAALISKASLEGSQVQLLPESSEDELIAKTMKFGDSQPDALRKRRREIRQSSIFANTNKGSSHGAGKRRLTGLLPTKGISKSRQILAKKGIDPCAFKLLSSRTPSSKDSKIQLDKLVVRKS